MADQPRKVRAEQLAPGMTVRAVTRFSNDYSYLDRTSIAFLREHFAGATCAITRGKGNVRVPVEGLQPLDALQSLDLPEGGTGQAPLDDAVIELLVQRGMKEFRVLDPPEPPAAEAVTPADGEGDAVQISKAREARTGGPSAKHLRRVADARDFLERVGRGATMREEAALLVRDLFSQGRAGKYNTKPAQQAVNEIISQGLAGAMAAIAGLRASDQTYAHCVDTAVIFEESYSDILRLEQREVNNLGVERTLLAGFCHDIGKSTVPREILDSTERFARGSREMQLMRSHSMAGGKILSDLGMDKVTVNVASYHHVKVDPSSPASYPEDAKWDEVMPITRLAAVVDVYQALIGKRSYKKNWVPGKAIEYLRSLRGTEFDPTMLDYFVRVMGLYPVGSLVRLNTGDLAFVVAIGTEVVERPVIAVVQNAAGELFTHNTLIDLMEEEDLSIVEVVDHYEHFADDTQPFRLFSGLKVA